MKSLRVSLKPEELSSSERYRLLSGCVVPRPIALVATMDASGLRNVAAFSFFNLAGDTPPTVMLSVDRDDDGGLKDTGANIEESGVFVVNTVTEEMAEAMVLASSPWPASVDEVLETGLEVQPCERVTGFRIAAAPVQLECRLVRTVGFDGFTVYFGEIVMMHVLDEALVDGKVITGRLGMIGRLAGPAYCRLGDDFIVRSVELDGPRRR